MTVKSSVEKYLIAAFTSWHCCCPSTSLCNELPTFISTDFVAWNNDKFYLFFFATLYTQTYITQLEFTIGISSCITKTIYIYIKSKTLRVKRCRMQTFNRLRKWKYKFRNGNRLFALNSSKQK